MESVRKALAVAAVSITVATPAMAEGGLIDEMRAGILLQGTGPFSADKEDGVGVNGEILLRPLGGLSFLGSPRPHLGLSVATADDATSQVYAGLTWRQNLGTRIFVDGGVGVAIHNGETTFEPGDPAIDTTKYLGCRALARLSGDLGYWLTDRISASLHVDHISNAGLCSENEGLDNAGLRLGLRF